MGSTIAGEIGVYGYRPSILMDILAGKRAEVGTKIGAYMRSFSGDCSPLDLETALQVWLSNFIVRTEESNHIIVTYSSCISRSSERSTVGLNLSVLFSVDF